MIRSKSASICTLFHANCGKITISKGVPLFDALVRGESPHSAAPKLPHWKLLKLETLGYHAVKTRILYLTRLFLHRVVTDGRTDRQTHRQTKSP